MFAPKNVVFVFLVGEHNSQLCLSGKFRETYYLNSLTTSTTARATLQTVGVDHCPLRSVAPGEARTGTGSGLWNPDFYEKQHQNHTADLKKTKHD